jgi:hypothetical protein
MLAAINYMMIDMMAGIARKVTNSAGCARRGVSRRQSLPAYKGQTEASGAAYESA